MHAVRCAFVDGGNGSDVSEWRRPEQQLLQSGAETCGVKANASPTPELTKSGRENKKKCKRKSRKRRQMEKGRKQTKRMSRKTRRKSIRGKQKQKQKQMYNIQTRIGNKYVYTCSTRNHQFRIIYLHPKSVCSLRRRQATRLT